MPSPFLSSSHHSPSHPSLTLPSPVRHPPTLLVSLICHSTPLHNTTLSSGFSPSYPPTHCHPCPSKRSSRFPSPTRTVHPLPFPHENSPPPPSTPSNVVFIEPPSIRSKTSRKLPRSCYFKLPFLARPLPALWLCGSRYDRHATVAALEYARSLVAKYIRNV